MDLDNENFYLDHLQNYARCLGSYYFVPKRNGNNFEIIQRLIIRKEL